jgi:uncharacterized damage-inducible protein DinB
MAISDSLLPEFDREMANTRRTLERVPDEKFSWTPHAKSSEMGALASHLARLASWATLTIQGDSFDLAPGGIPARFPPLTSNQEVLDTFDKGIADARAALTAATDEVLRGPWTLLSNGQTLWVMPRLAVLRGFVFNHMIHHRAQLGVYLRLNDLPVPSIYGPSADEGM